MKIIQTTVSVCLLMLLFQACASTKSLQEKSDKESLESVKQEPSDTSFSKDKEASQTDIPKVSDQDAESRRDRIADSLPDGTNVPEPSPAQCLFGYENPVVSGWVDASILGEISGIAPSPTHPEVLWVHNDSGDDAKIYAISISGELLGTLKLPGIEAEDFEDLSTGPCPHTEGQCLWVGDIGNNLKNRDQLMVYVVPEPAIQLDKPFGEIEAVGLQSYPFRYPKDTVNSEALFLDQKTMDLYILEKADAAQIRLFRHPGPFIDGSEQTLETVASFPAPGIDVEYGKLITAADLHPSGRRLLVRVYSGSYEYLFDTEQTLSDISKITHTLAYPGPLSEPQGEASCYDISGTGFWTISENQKGKDKLPLHHYSCKPGAPVP